MLASIAYDESSAFPVFDNRLTLEARIALASQRANQRHTRRQRPHAGASKTHSAQCFTHF
jgi:hypothetical protein